MTGYVNLYFHFGGKWMYEPEMTYVGGYVDIQKDFDVDFLNFIDIVNEFKSLCGYKDIKVVYGREHGIEDNNMFIMIENDFGIRKLVDVLTPQSTGVDFYVVKQTDELSDDVDDGFFVCLDACKRGFKEGCRPLIGLDGCFLKTEFKGELLVAVAKDAQDQNFPLAWACVNKETKVNWSWFLTLLANALELGDGAEYTYISDMQKGLVQAIIDVQPAAEHRWCARHIYANWSKKWSGRELRKKIWICVWSTYEEEFQDHLKELAEVSKQAAVDLMKYPPHTWCRAYFSSRCKSMCVDNNMCESFNAWILEGRHKPIRSLMDYIRKRTMERISSMDVVADKWIGNYSPACMEMFEAYKMATIGCNILFNGDSGYEIVEGEDTHTVFLDKQVCTCKAWDLSGIPCQHAMCAYVHNKRDPADYISKWYHKDTFKAAYKWKLQPLRGKKFWHCEKYQPIEPPKIESQTGRPKKKRVRAENEVRTSSGTKLTRKGKSVTCKKCNQQGHNTRTCQNIVNPENNSEVPQTVAVPENLGHVPTKKSTLPHHENTAVQELAGTSRKRTIKQMRQAARSSSLHKATKTSGMGILYDKTTGSMSFTTGSKIMQCTDGTLPHSSDPNLTFPIPNEREYRVDKIQGIRQTSSTSQSNRRIRIRDVGGPVNMACMPIHPPGLQWRGRNCITTRQLEEMKQLRKSQTSSK